MAHMNEADWKQLQEEFEMTDGELRHFKILERIAQMKGKKFGDEFIKGNYILDSLV